MRLFLIACLTLLGPLAARADSLWQITFRYDDQGPREILDARKIAALKKTPFQPGLSNAAEIHSARISWRHAGSEIFSGDVEMPLGNRFGATALRGGVGVVRVAGPDSMGEGDLITLSLRGEVQRRLAISGRASAPRTGTLEYALKSGNRYQILDGAVSTVKVVDHGSDTNRFVMVIIGDGYLAEDIQNGVFSQDVQSEISYLQGQSPWAELLAVSNIYAVSVVSNEAGADDPCAPDSAPGCQVAVRDTYFNTSYGYGGIDRLLAPNSEGVARALAVSDSQVGAGVWDSIFLLVNSNKYGGSGGLPATASRTGSEVLLHEVGHTIGGLADEYSDPFPGYPETITEPNVDSESAHPKWWRWITRGAVLPTPDIPENNSIIGAFEGARYKTTGVFRPMRTCKMRTLGAPFCPVCKEALANSVLSHLSVIDGSSPPTESSVILDARLRKFQVRPIKIGAAKVKWSFCGRTLPSTQRSILLSRNNLRRSSCKLKATTTLTSGLVRSSAYAQTIQWTLRK